jgi:hypothetical protein
MPAAACCGYAWLVLRMAEDLVGMRHNMRMVMSIRIGIILITRKFLFKNRTNNGMLSFRLKLVSRANVSNKTYL